MKKPWYYRMLLSYLPVFFFITSLANFSIYNQTLYQFFQSNDKTDVMLNSKMLKEIAELKRQYPIVDSLYLVRTQDGTVFSEKYIFQLKEFPDNSYIEFLKQGQQSLQWSSPRNYIDFTKKHKVITLAKNVFLSKGEPCIVVRNSSRHSPSRIKYC